MSRELDAAVKAMRDHDPSRLECHDHEGVCCPCGALHDGTAELLAQHRAERVVSAYCEVSAATAWRMYCYRCNRVGLGVYTLLGEQHPEGPATVLEGTKEECVRMCIEHWGLDHEPKLQRRTTTRWISVPFVS